MMDLLQSRLYDVMYGTDYTEKALELAFIDFQFDGKPQPFDYYRQAFPTEDADDTTDPRP